MADKGIINIHGKEYMTVARRLEIAHEEKKLHSVKTAILSHDPVVIQATVTIDGWEYQGISSVSLTAGKMIEKSNPYEVAETSAVGRALGFAGYGLIGSVASADEVQRSVTRQENGYTYEKTPEATEDENMVLCKTCKQPAQEKRGFTKEGHKPYHGIFCSTGNKKHTEWINDQE